LPPDEALPPGLLAVVDTVGADIFARLVVERIHAVGGGAIHDTVVERLADIALSAASVWGLRRHQTCEPCIDRIAP